MEPQIDSIDEEDTKTNFDDILIVCEQNFRQILDTRFENETILTLNEFIDIVSESGIVNVLTDNEIVDIFNKMDVNQSGSISIDLLKPNNNSILRDVVANKNGGNTNTNSNTNNDNGNGNTHHSRRSTHYLLHTIRNYMLDEQRNIISSTADEYRSDLTNLSGDDSTTSNAASKYRIVSQKLAHLTRVLTVFETENIELKAKLCESEKQIGLQKAGHSETKFASEMLLSDNQEMRHNLEVIGNKQHIQEQSLKEMTNNHQKLTSENETLHLLLEKQNVNMKQLQLNCERAKALALEYQAKMNEMSINMEINEFGHETDQQILAEHIRSMQEQNDEQALKLELTDAPPSLYGYGGQQQRPTTTRYMVGASSATSNETTSVDYATEPETPLAHILAHQFLHNPSLTPSMTGEQYFGDISTPIGSGGGGSSFEIDQQPPYHRSAFSAAAADSNGLFQFEDKQQSRDWNTTTPKYITGGTSVEAETISAMPPLTILPSAVSMEYNVSERINRNKNRFYNNAIVNENNGKQPPSEPGGGEGGGFHQKSQSQSLVALGVPLNKSRKSHRRRSTGSSTHLTLMQLERDIEIQRLKNDNAEKDLLISSLENKMKQQAFDEEDEELQNLKDTLNDRSIEIQSLKTIIADLKEVNNEHIANSEIKTQNLIDELLMKEMKFKENAEKLSETLNNLHHEIAQLKEDRTLLNIRLSEQSAEIQKLNQQPADTSFYSSCVSYFVSSSDANDT